MSLAGFTIKLMIFEMKRKKFFFLFEAGVIWTLYFILSWVCRVLTFGLKRYALRNHRFKQKSSEHSLEVNKHLINSILPPEFFKNDEISRNPEKSFCP